MIIGVKYCGGCNPRYNRREIVTRLKDDFPDLLIGTTKEKHDFTLILAGCNVVCLKHDGHMGSKGKFVFRSENDYDSLYKIIINHINN